MAARFAELTTTRSGQTSEDSIGMEEAQGNYRSTRGEHMGWMSIWAWKERTPMRHGEQRNEDMNMVETIKNLQKNVQSHKDDNESIMKSKE
jgi:hypothetical protein